MGSLSRRTYAILAIALVAVAFMAVNIAADALLTTARLDLTETGQFTLAEGTRSTVAKLQEPVTLKFFFSKQAASRYAQTQAYAKRVRDLLGEYAALSHGKIIIQDVDPEPFTPEEDEATADGLSGAGTDASGVVVYFGLVGTNRIGGKEVISYFAPEREPLLEYDLTSLIYKLSTPKKPTVGIISSLPLDTGPGGMAAAMQGHAQPYAAYEDLSQAYAPQMLEPNFSSIPAGIDVLMIVHPSALNDQQLYAIDQFVLGGGRALVFVDPYSELAQAAAGGDPQSAGPPSSDLPKLFRAWGIGYNPEKIVADKALAQRVQISNDPNDPPALYPAWLHLTADNFNPADPLTANLQTLNLASVGALHALKGATTRFVPLVKSSNEAALLDAALVRMSARPQDLITQVEPTGEEFTIAARVSGPVHTAFPGGPPGAGASPLQPNAVEPQLKTGIVNVVVMADSDIFDDHFWVKIENLFGKKVASPFADNGAFVVNAVENLTGSNDLISLRTRATNDRPFIVVRKLQANAEERFQQEEDALKQRLTDTEQRLHAIEQGGGGASTSATLTAEQQTEIEHFKRDLMDTRAQLRDVEHNLRKDIDALGAFLAFVNIALVPLLVSALAILLGWLRRRRRARALAL
jgi:ABC-type uncharacterized transport system involved in gliding motility auxiliary subunit